MPVIIDGTNGITQAGEFNSDSSFGFKNRIINGAMVIDQRNAGASVTTNGAFPVDRFFVSVNNDGAYSANQDTNAPVGFVNSFKWTTTTADSSLAAGQYAGFLHRIEGNNMADFGWGTANAKTVTLSFWTRSSLTGTFSGSFVNNATNRSYVFTYTISTADTWEFKTITITGDTTGTWLTNNGIGVSVVFSLGTGSTYSGTAGSWSSNFYLAATGGVSVIGTLNATFYITGVQLEVGSTATSFDYRPYGTELALCQRYFETNFNYGTAPAAGVSFANSSGHVFSAYTTTNARSEGILFAVPKRGAPNITFYRTSLNGSNDNSWNLYINPAWTNSSTPTGQSTGGNFASFQADATFSGMSTGSAYIGAGNWAASAEL